MAISAGADATAADVQEQAPIGAVVMYAAASAPGGWLLCDGAAVSRATYATLFALISTTYGVGDGSTTFNVPNLKGRVPVGLDGAQTEFDALAETGGAKTHTLIASEIPAHTHDFPVYAGSGGTGRVRTADAANPAGTESPASFGSGAAHNNLQPYLVLNFIIKYRQGA